jgi:hypothetical protein
MALVGCGIVLQVTTAPAPASRSAACAPSAKTACTARHTGARHPAALSAATAAAIVPPLETMSSTRTGRRLACGARSGSVISTRRSPTRCFPKTARRAHEARDGCDPLDALRVRAQDDRRLDMPADPLGQQRGRVDRIGGNAEEVGKRGNAVEVGIDGYEPVHGMREQPGEVARTDAITFLKAAVLPEVRQIRRDQAHRCGAEIARSLGGEEQRQHFVIRAIQARHEHDGLAAHRTGDADSPLPVRESVDLHGSRGTVQIPRDASEPLGPGHREDDHRLFPTVMISP